MKSFINFFKGLLIGCGLIAPGVSGSVLAIVLGIYDEIIFTVNNFFKNVKKNMVFLLPIIIGVILGVMFFSKVLLFVIERFKTPTMYIFMGLIVGSIPKLLKEIELKTNNGINWISFTITLLISIILLIIEKEYVSVNSIIVQNNIPYLYLFICGILYGAGKIIPGLSSSALLILMGMYEYFLHLIGNITHLSLLEMKSIIPFIIGLVVSLIILIKVMNYLLTKHYRITMSIILALVLSSLLILFPGIGFTMEYLFSTVLFVVVTSIFISIS